MAYLVHSPADRAAMLAALGLGDVSELYADVPTKLAGASFELPEGAPELAVAAEVLGLASRNRTYPARLCFRGAGVYQHFVPSIVAAVTSKPEFYSAYTPYQAEASQGTLQAIFEFQTMVAELTGLDVANASMYDGASSLAEACLMALAHTGRDQVVVAGYLHPEYLEVLETYAWARGFHVKHHLDEGGQVRPSSLACGLGPRVGAVVYQQPNFMGLIEDAGALCDAAHAAGALAVACVEPLSLTLLAPPGECGADIAAGDGQSLGLRPSYGGPHLGLLACRGELVRRLPGRLVGQAHDGEGRRGFTLTLQAREQHIRRARATSNICTNHSLCALAATAYISYMGPRGLAHVAGCGLVAAHQLRRRLEGLEGWSATFAGACFNEFAMRCQDPAGALARLSQAGILGGVELGRWFPELSDSLLFSCTEVNDQAALDAVLEALR